MSNTKSSNQTAVPEAKGALDRFKFEVANELGVPLTDGYNGNLTSKQNGSVGGYMVKKIVSEQPLNFNSLYFISFPESLSTTEQHSQVFRKPSDIDKIYG